MSTKETKVAHTPLPWTTMGVANPATDPRMSLWGPRPHGAESGEWIAKDIRPANVEFILRACNTHADLLACLRRMCGMYGAYSRRLAPLLAEDEGTVWTFERANSLALEAIAKAEGQ